MICLESSRSSSTFFPRYDGGIIAIDLVFFRENAWDLLRASRHGSQQRVVFPSERGPGALHFPHTHPGTGAFPLSLIWMVEVLDLGLEDGFTFAGEEVVDDG